MPSILKRLSRVIKVPKDLDYEAASMIEPVSDVVAVLCTGAPLRRESCSNRSRPNGCNHVMGGEGIPR